MDFRRITLSPTVVFRMSKMKNVLIISYARPAGVQRLLESCLESGVDKVYISLDGPGNPQSNFLQESILQIIGEYSGKIEISVNRLDKNNGVGVGVIRAIDWFFQNVNEGVILEDDLLVAPSFFQFMFRCLGQVSIENKVMMVSGTRVFPASHDELCSSIYPMIWGWGTSATSWQIMRQALIAPKKLGLKYIFSPEYWYWYVGAQRTLEGLVDTWDTPLAFEFFNRRWECVYPPKNLVSNLGFDDFAVHTTAQIFPLGIPVFEGQLESWNLVGAKFDPTYTRQLKTELFRVRPKHVLLLFWAMCNDSRTFQKNSRRAPLGERLQAH